MNHLLLAVTNFVAQAADVATPTNILFGAVASLTAAVVALYKDCRNCWADRAKLWERVKALEEKISN